MKIASIWHYTSLYEAGPMQTAQGIQIGQDIFQAADLDTLFLTNEADVMNFCKNILFKRLVSMCPALEGLEQNGVVNDTFITELFDNDRNFKAFICASHGIPREMMELFRNCAAKIGKDFEHDCISKEIVLEVSRLIYRTKKAQRIKDKPLGAGAEALLARITDYMASQKRRLFLVRTADATASEALRKLVDEELVHPLPNEVIHFDLNDHYNAYIIDYGNFADWVDAKRQPVDQLIDELVVPNFPDNIGDHVSEYLISIADGKAQYRHCNHCNATFSLYDPAYKPGGNCVACGKPFDASPFDLAAR